MSEYPRTSRPNLKETMDYTRTKRLISTKSTPLILSRKKRRRKREERREKKQQDTVTIRTSLLHHRLLFSGSPTTLFIFFSLCSGLFGSWAIMVEH
jgi:hypothetical protein